MATASNFPPSPPVFAQTPDFWLRSRDLPIRPLLFRKPSMECDAGTGYLPRFLHLLLTF